MLKRSSYLLAPVSLLGLLAFTWPLFIPESNFFLLQGSNTKWLAAAVLPIAILLFIFEINYSGLDSKSVALLGVFAALICALRLLGAGAIGIEPIWFLLVLIGRVFGPSFGFTLGVTSLFASALLTGAIGPWLAFQMLAAGWVAMFAGYIPRKISGKLEIFVISIYAIIATQFFGILMNLQLWPWLIGTDSQLSYVASGAVIDNLQRFALFHLATSLSWDIPRAIFTVILISIAGKPILVALRRAKVKLEKTSSGPGIQQKVA
jgi:energy-coupling factor transport system substrate-specific component